MDKERIWQTATEDIPVLKAFCERELGKIAEEILGRATLKQRCSFTMAFGHRFDAVHGHPAYAPLPAASA